MLHILRAAFAVWAFALPVAAQQSPVVVELFTSQGCASCPPADELMRSLAEQDDVIALSLHVDYWDYIGWKDEFADPKNAQRQRAYAHAAGRRSVYTPEMIVNGESDIVGAKPMQLAAAIEKHKSVAKRVDVQLLRAGSMVTISARALRQGLDPMEIVMLRYTPSRVSQITRGENKGKTLEYVNVTHDWQVVAHWDGQAALDLDAPVAGDLPIVVLVQTEGHGPIVGAARLR